MAGTTSRGYRYPTNTDAPNIATDIQNLASDVNNDVGNLGTWVSWTPTYSGTGWSMTFTNNSKYVQIGKIVFFNLNIQTTGVVTVDSGSLVFQLPSALSVAQETIDVQGDYSLYLAGGYPIMGTIQGGSRNLLIYVPTSDTTAGRPLTLQTMTSSTYLSGSGSTPRTWSLSGFYRVA